MTIPPSLVTSNKSLFAHFFLGRPGSKRVFAKRTAILTAYAVRRKASVMLLDSVAFMQSNATAASSADDVSSTGEAELTVPHWHPSLSLHVARTDMKFPASGIPEDIHRLMQWYDNRYLPILYINPMVTRHKKLLPIDKNTTTMPLSVHYSPYMLGRVRLWSSFEQSFVLLRSIGLAEKDFDELKELFTIDWRYLSLTFFVSVVHMLFDVLAFKNDIAYWKGRKTMAGLSRNAVVLRCVSQCIVFAYLMDETTSWLVLIPSGFSCIIELWKVTKAFKVRRVRWRGFGHLPLECDDSMTAEETETKTHDSVISTYILYSMVVFVIGCAGYSLLFWTYTSWWSWMIQNAAYAIYVLGFLMMLPQLYINYKLKSVAHLPWRVFTYKFFNTFIDDVFAFIITMPTAHRLAVFRDDLVFFIFLFQRWLYPVDKKRVNEFGVSYDDDGKAAAGNQKESEETEKTSLETKKNL